MSHWLSVCSCQSSRTRRPGPLRAAGRCLHWSQVQSAAISRKRTQRGCQLLAIQKRKPLCAQCTGTGAQSVFQTIHELLEKSKSQKVTTSKGGCENRDTTIDNRNGGGKGGRSAECWVLRGDSETRKAESRNVEVGNRSGEDKGRGFDVVGHGKASRGQQTRSRRP
jgi:hypothetical protein